MVDCRYGQEPAGRDDETDRPERERADAPDTRTRRCLQAAPPEHEDEGNGDQQKQAEDVAEIPEVGPRLILPAEVARWRLEIPSKIISAALA